jgi:sulfur relay (sulfurtransferase) complex TusBCD TusD component (DsrE family)
MSVGEALRSGVRPIWSGIHSRDAIMAGVRTTVTIDADLAARLRALAREHGVSFEEALNSALRRGLTSDAGKSKQRYQLASRPLKLRTGVDFRKALRLAASLEDAETIRKLDT